MAAKGVTVYAPKTIVGPGGPLRELMLEAVSYGFARSDDAPVMHEGESVAMQKIEGMRSAAISAEEVLAIFSVSTLTRVENYNCWIEIPAANLNDAVPFDVLPVGGTTDAEGNVLDPGQPRTWAQMPSFRELDGRYFCEAAAPINREPVCSGRKPLSSADLRWVFGQMASGFALIDNSTIRDLQAAEAPVEP